MSGFRITIKNARLARALREAPEDITRELDRAIGRGALQVSRTARRLAPKATSLLTNSIGVSRPGRLEALISPAVDYAAAVEEGTGPGGNPPHRSIVDWLTAGNSGISPRNPGDDVDDLAWRIIHKIRREGTPAQPFMGPAVEQEQGDVLRRMDAAVEKVLRAL